MSDDPEIYHEAKENFSWAIMSLFAWVLPHISMEIGEYHRALNKSRVWNSDDENDDDGGRSKSAQTTGREAVRSSALASNLLAIALIVGAAAGVAANTKNLDARMDSIVTGLSRLVGATFLFGLSWNFPEWLEVYHITKRRPVLPVTNRSVRTLKFRLFRAVMKEYTKIYFFLLPFYCGAKPATIPVAAVVGIVVGSLVDACVFVGRKQVWDGNTRRAFGIVYGMIFVFLLGSGALFADGCLYINDIWGSQDKVAGLGIACFFAWLAVGVSVHFFLWRRTRDAPIDERRSGAEEAAVAKSAKYKNIIGEKIAVRGEKMTGTAKKKVFGSDVSGKTTTEKKEEQQHADHALDEEEGDESLSKTGVADDDAPPQQEEEERRSKVGFVDDLSQTKEASSPEEETADPILQANDDEEKETGRWKGEEEEQEQERHLSVDHGGASDVLFVQADDEEPTYRSLVRAELSRCCHPPCGCCACCSEDTTRRQKVVSCGKLTLWLVLSFFCLYFVAVNLGATYQQDVVRTKLPSVKVILYQNMSDIEVCAYDGDGTGGSLNENSTITTFPGKDAARDAGFLILHCGPCAACSTWPNIKYEYTTRDFLASASAACGRKSLFGGADAVLDCLMSEPINWDHDCGTCWTTDILCAKGYCALNFLQSVMINTMTNFAVGQDEVTAATCEEANCEAFDYPENFVECSGATRRRMNVTSSIARPKDEECANIDVDWATLFPGE